MHLYEILAEPIRRRIVEVLASGEHNAGTLEQVACCEFGVGRSAAQHHLRILKLNGWVDVRPELAERWYRLEDDVVPQIEAEAEHFRERWDQRIGWNEKTDPLQRWKPRVGSPASRRGRRGYGIDPDDPWIRMGETN